MTIYTIKEINDITQQLAQQAKALAQFVCKYHPENKSLQAALYRATFIFEEELDDARRKKPGKKLRGQLRACEKVAHKLEQIAKKAKIHLVSEQEEYATATRKIDSILQGYGNFDAPDGLIKITQSLQTALLISDKHLAKAVALYGDGSSEGITTRIKTSKQDESFLISANPGNPPLQECDLISFAERLGIRGPGCNPHKPGLR